MKKFELQITYALASIKFSYLMQIMDAEKVPTIKDLVKALAFRYAPEDGVERILDDLFFAHVKQQ